MRSPKALQSIVANAIWIVTIAAALILALAVYRYRHAPLAQITGVVLRQNGEAANQSPVANVAITLSGDLAEGAARSDASGLFHLKLRPGIYAGQDATLTLQHANFQTANILEILQDRLYVLRIVPVAEPSVEQKLISSIKVRYLIRTTTVEDVGTTAKRFDVINKGDVPCERGGTCSPNRKWKAVVGGVTLDAFDETEFRNARVTCIAGPCPFTRILKDGFSRGGKKLSVSILDWSDTTSFLLEADVMRAASSDLVRWAFPVVVNRVLRFTLPAAAQGPSIQATVNGEDIVYPLGPDLTLSWATCTATQTTPQTQLFQCDLKAGYKFP